MLADLAPAPAATAAQLEALETELADLAFALECAGRLDGADVANTLRHRLVDLRHSLAEAPR